MKWMLLVLILYGAGLLTIALVGETGIALKMIGGFGSMFAGILGIGSGYFLGRIERQSQEKRKEDTHDST